MAGEKKKEGIFYGFTKKGEKFEIPPTLDTVDVFNPLNLNIASFFSCVLVALWIYATFFLNFSVWTHVALFIFWRLAYNLGLGLLLSAQSKRQAFTQFYERWATDKTRIGKLLQRMAKDGLPPSHRHSSRKYPSAFYAWLLYQQLVNLILLNDSAHYLLLGWKCAHLPPSLSFPIIAQYIAGFALAIFNYWAKVDAHRCIGEYCWYWGDFFFQKSQTLTFDGIFELFPHPMYTVGYSLYYGYSLICRSYTMLFVSITAHLMQLTFLFLVEEPHIQRTYGTDAPKMEADRFRILYDPKNGLFPQRKDSIFFFQFNAMRVQDLSLIVFTVYGLAFCFLVQDRIWCVYQVILWRCLHWFGLGGVLWFQSNYQFWTAHFIQRGRTLYEAFSHWKGIYNLSLTMNVVVFIGCALRYIEFDITTCWATPSFWARVIGGSILIVLAVWTSHSTYKAVGEFGWFYGDFFISKDTFQQSFCETGIYRFVNNPDAITGYAGWYGISLITQSWEIFLLALFSQLLNALFLQIVEVPHMNKLYSERVRKDAPLGRVVKKILPAMPKTKADLEFKRKVRQIKNKAFSEIWSLYKARTQKRKTESKTGASHLPPKSPKTPPKTKPRQHAELNAPEKIRLGQSLVVSFETTAEHSELDWIGVYSADVESVPGLSGGKWMYVGKASSGQITFSPSVLPDSTGFYEIRYHLDNKYTVIQRRPLMIEPPSTEDTDSDNEDEENGR